MPATTGHYTYSFAPKFFQRGVFPQAPPSCCCTPTPSTKASHRRSPILVERTNTRAMRETSQLLMANLSPPPSAIKSPHLQQRIHALESAQLTHNRRQKPKGGQAIVLPFQEESPHSSPRRGSIMKSPLARRQQKQPSPSIVKSESINDSFQPVWPPAESSWQAQPWEDNTSPLRRTPTRSKPGVRRRPSFTPAREPSPQKTNNQEAKAPNMDSRINNFLNRLSSLGGGGSSQPPDHFRLSSASRTKPISPETNTAPSRKKLLDPPGAELEPLMVATSSSLSTEASTTEDATAWLQGMLDETVETSSKFADSSLFETKSQRLPQPASGYSRDVSAFPPRRLGDTPQRARPIQSPPRPRPSFSRKRQQQPMVQNQTTERRQDRAVQEDPMTSEQEQSEREEAGSLLFPSNEMNDSLRRANDKLSMIRRTIARETSSPSSSAYSLSRSSSCILDSPTKRRSLERMNNRTDPFRKSEEKENEDKLIEQLLSTSSGDNIDALKANAFRELDETTSGCANEESFQDLMNKISSNSPNNNYPFDFQVSASLDSSRRIKSEDPPAHPKAGKPQVDRPVVLSQSDSASWLPRSSSRATRSISISGSHVSSKPTARTFASMTDDTESYEDSVAEFERMLSRVDIEEKVPTLAIRKKNEPIEVKMSVLTDPLESSQGSPSDAASTNMSVSQQSMSDPVRDYWKSFSNVKGRGSFDSISRANDPDYVKNPNTGLKLEQAKYLPSPPRAAYQRAMTPPRNNWLQKNATDKSKEQDESSSPVYSPNSRKAYQHLLHRRRDAQQTKKTDQPGTETKQIEDSKHRRPEFFKPDADKKPQVETKKSMESIPSWPSFVTKEKTKTFHAEPKNTEQLKPNQTTPKPLSPLQPRFDSKFSSKGAEHVRAKSPINRRTLPAPEKVNSEPQFTNNSRSSSPLVSRAFPFPEKSPVGKPRQWNNTDHKKTKDSPAEIANQKQQKFDEMISSAIKYKMNSPKKVTALESKLVAAKSNSQHSRKDCEANLKKSPSSQWIRSRYENARSPRSAAPNVEQHSSRSAKSREPNADQNSSRSAKSPEPQKRAPLHEQTSSTNVKPKPLRSPQPSAMQKPDSRPSQVKARAANVARREHSTTPPRNQVSPPRPILKWNKGHQDRLDASPSRGRSQRSDSKHGGFKSPGKEGRGLSPGPPHSGRNQQQPVRGHPPLHSPQPPSSRTPGVHRPTGRSPVRKKRSKEEEQPPPPSPQLSLYEGSENFTDNEPDVFAAFPGYTVPDARIQSPVGFSVPRRQRQRYSGVSAADSRYNRRHRSLSRGASSPRSRSSTVTGQDYTSSHRYRDIDEYYDDIEETLCSAENGGPSRALSPRELLTSCTPRGSELKNRDTWATSRPCAAIKENDSSQLYPVSSQEDGETLSLLYDSINRDPLFTDSTEGDETTTYFTNLTEDETLRTDRTSKIDDDETATLDDRRRQRVDDQSCKSSDPATSNTCAMFISEGFETITSFFRFTSANE